MKKLFLLSLLAANFALVADEPVLITPRREVPPLKFEQKRHFLYLKMGAGDSHPTHEVNVIPSLGIGYRFNSGSSAIDFSANYMGGNTLGGNRNNYYYSLPRVTYLRYLSPLSDQTLYAGVGAGWGWLRAFTGQTSLRKFTGIVASGTVGLEMNRNAGWHSFFQIDVSQPAIAATTKGAFPGPIAEISLGAGF